MFFNFESFSFESAVLWTWHRKSLTFFCYMLHISIIIAPRGVIIEFNSTNLTEFKLQFDYVLGGYDFWWKFLTTKFIRTFEFTINFWKRFWLLFQLVINWITIERVFLLYLFVKTLLMILHHRINAKLAKPHLAIGAF